MGEVGSRGAYPRPFEAAVFAELFAARAVHRTPLNSAHEAYAVILEGLEGFWAEVRKGRADRDAAAMLAELIQIAAVCQRAAEDLGLIDR